MDSERLSPDAAASEPAGSLGSQSEAAPLFRVKRYRKRDSPLVIAPVVQPKTKSSSPVAKTPVNRWDGVHIAAGYQPPSSGSLQVGGLPPPASSLRWSATTPLHVGGLQCDLFPALKVHQGALSLQVSMEKVHPKSGPSDRSVALVQPVLASAPLQISGNVVAATESASSTMLEIHHQLKQQHIQAWLQLLQEAGSHSELLQTTLASDTPAVHQARVVARFAPSTLAAYLRTWKTWLDFCHCHQACPYRPSTTLVADFLQVSSRKSALGVATAQSRSLVYGCRSMLAFQSLDRPWNHH